MSTDKYLTYRGDVKAVAVSGGAVVFVTVHPEGQPTAVYRLDRTNTRSTDPNDPTRIVQTGSQQTNGFEAGVAGNATRSIRDTSSGPIICVPTARWVTTLSLSSARPSAI